MARDKLAEIAEIRARNGGRGWWQGQNEMALLQSEWRRGEGPLQIPAQFIAIRLVTILEVFTRDWVAQIIDSGEPYIGRAADFVRGALKIDFAMAQALVGKQVTFGELISHEIQVNSVGDIDRVFSHLLNTSLFAHLDGLTSRWAIRTSDAPVAPMMVDPVWTRTKLAELFKTRHIIVHELPDDQSIATEAVADFVRAAGEFLDAADEAFSTLLHGEYPITQSEMNDEAAAKAQLADDELAVVLEHLDPTRADKTLWAAQSAWTDFRRLQAEYRSGINDKGHGSISSLLYASELESITRARLEQLKGHLDREEGEM